MHTEMDYQDVRHQMRPGDLIAFGGNSLFSRWTKLTTRSVVTHIALVMQTQVRGSNDTRFFNQIIEATVYGGKRGVMINRISDRLATYDGDIWWLPLGQTARTTFEANQTQFFDYLMQQRGKDYDVWQLFGSAVDLTDNHPILGLLSQNQEDISSWFCSELVAAGLREARVLPALNVSEVTPIDLCRMPIFTQHYVQIKGETTAIRGFNGGSLLAGLD